MGYKFSLVIPLAPDRGAEIVNSIRKLDYSKSDFNVIVVKGKNPSQNRNIGAINSIGNFIVFLDDDAVIDKNYLKNLQKFFAEYPDIDIVGGVQLTPENDKRFAKISGYALGSKFGGWKTSNRYSGEKIMLDADETMLTSSNLVCRKKVMQNVKFDPKLFPGEDPKFISDAKEYGYKIAYNPNLIIYHRRRPTLKGMIKQIYLYGKTRPRKESFFETLFKRPFFLIPSAFLIYLFLLIIVVLSNPSITGNVIGEGFKNKNLLIFLPLFFYVILAFIFSVYDSLKNKNYKAIPLLFFIYPIIHLSYGAGFLTSTIKNLFKHKK